MPRPSAAPHAALVPALALAACDGARGASAANPTPAQAALNRVGGSVIAATLAATLAAMPDTQFARVFRAAEAHTVMPATVAWMTAANAVAERHGARYEAIGRGTAAAMGSAMALDAPPSAGAWILDRDRDEMEVRETVTLRLDANAPMEFSFPYEGRTAALLIRCNAGKTELAVIVHAQLQPQYDENYDSSPRVRYRFDGRAPVAARWTESTSGAAVFAPQPVALARRLARTSEWKFQFTPFQHAPVTTTFRTEGLAAVLPHVAKSCGWKA
jgi:hypothetical protein